MNESLADPIVADLELACRLERAEGRANAEFVDAHAAAFPEVGSTWIEVAGTLAMYNGADSPCTQTFGLGLFERVTKCDLDEVEQFFQSRSAPVFHETCPLADDSLVKLLNERRYQPFEFSNVLFRDLREFATPRNVASRSVCSRLAEPGEVGLWARIAAEGWSDVAPGVHDFILDLERVNEFRHSTRCFLAEMKGTPVAAAALGLKDGVALFAGACTIPKWRNRGAQQSLLEYRLRYAADHGCDLAMIAAAPGSASQRNAERSGFRIAYTRIKWRLPVP